MAKADREPIVLYQAFCPDAGETSPSSGRPWGAVDIAAAARLHAGFLARSGFRLDHEGTLLVYVCDPSNMKLLDGQFWEVTVDVRIEPVFDVTKRPRLVT